MNEQGRYPFFTCNEYPYKIDTYAFDTEAILISGNGSQVGHLNYYNGKFNAYQRTYVLSDFITTFNIQFIFQYLKNNPLYDTMFMDVNSVLTLNIFESEV